MSYFCAWSVGLMSMGMCIYGPKMDGLWSDQMVPQEREQLNQWVSIGLCL